MGYIQPVDKWRPSGDTMSLRDQVLQTSDALNLLLVFLSILFGIRYGEIIACLKEEIPAGLRSACRLRSRVITILCTGCLPATLISLLATYLFLPLTCEVLTTYRFSPWRFDPVISGFVLIEAIMMALTLWMLVLSGKVINKWRQVNHRINEYERRGSQ